MRLLDLFCGAGGAAMGYHRAGFEEIVGVDVKPQPRYPFEFIQADAMTFPLGGFDAIHASPPCQAFTDLRARHRDRAYLDLLTPTLNRLAELTTPWVVENVDSAPMRAPIILCGSALGLGVNGARLQRHRLFETNWPLLAPPCQHRRGQRVIGVYGGHGRDRRRRINSQNFSLDERRQAMEIDWMTGNELSQAVPPAYTEYIGKRLLAAIKERAA